MASDSPTEITVNDIGEYVRHKSCDRRFHLTVHYDREVRPLPFFDRLLNTLEPVLQVVGKEREDQWEQELAGGGFRDAAAGLPRDKHGGVSWSDLAAALAKLPPGTDAYAREVRVEAVIGAFEVKGRVDFVLLRWAGGRPTLWLVECKASRRDRTYHRVQVAAYRMILRRMLGTQTLNLSGGAVSADSVECVVARIDEAQNANQSILALPPLDLASEEADVELLLGVGGRLDRVVALPLADLGYRLDAKCDGCVYNVHCLTESARRRRPELLGLDPVSAHLSTIDRITRFRLQRKLNRSKHKSELPHRLDVGQQRATGVPTSWEQSFPTVWVRPGYERLVGPHNRPEYPPPRRLPTTRLKRRVSSPSSFPRRPYN